MKQLILQTLVRLLEKLIVSVTLVYSKSSSLDLCLRNCKDSMIFSLIHTIYTETEMHCFSS